MNTYHYYFTAKSVLLESQFNFTQYLLQVFKVSCLVQVAYREILDGNIAHSATASSVVGERKMKHECSVTLEIFSDQKARPFEKVIIL